MNPISKSKKFLDTMFYRSQQPYLVNSEKIDMVRSLWSDEESRIAYDREIIFKILKPLVGAQNAQSVSKSGMDQKTFDDLIEKSVHDMDLPKISPHADSETTQRCLVPTFYLQQYQYKNFVYIHTNDIVLDCGACFGDTAIWFLHKGAKQVWSFEVDRENLVCLAETLQMNNAAESVHIVSKALGKANGELWYNQWIGNPGGGVVSLAHTEKSYGVSVTTIDNFCAENGIQPDFIKMDIEGSELDALTGAEHYIRSQHPDLAICLYHRPTDMWTIPLLIKNFCPNYRFYCKKSSYMYEYVLFATCRS